MTRPGALKLSGAVRHYEWGGHEFIPRLIGVANPEKKPFAELWIGAHPHAPSIASLNGISTPLDKLISEAPEEHLGADPCSRFGSALPYLFKVLDVAKMLSIQAHPGKAQAEEGFARENAAGIPLDAAHRNYKDRCHKPEIGVALTDFWMLHGFRSLEEIGRTFDLVPELASAMPQFSSRLREAGADHEARRRLLRELYSSIMNMTEVQVDDRLNRLLLRLGKQDCSDKDRHEYWVIRAARDFPLPGGHRDRGILSIYLLNLLHLRPGQGTFQPAGVLHAYLEGVNVELMANSDNVIRGGLTPKHIDVPELLKLLSFEDRRPEIIEAHPISAAESIYPTPTEEFQLSRIELAPGAEFIGDARIGPEEILILEGSAHFVSAALPATPEPDSVSDSISHRLQGGSILFVPCGQTYRLRAAGSPVVAFKASLPSHLPFTRS